MTSIRISIRKPNNQGGSDPMRGRVMFQPIRRHFDNAKNLIVPQPINVELDENGMAVADVMPTTDGSFVWKVVELAGDRVYAYTRYVDVPDSSTVIDYADLRDVDTTTGLPVGEETTLLEDIRKAISATADSRQQAIDAANTADTAAANANTSAGRADTSAGRADTATANANKAITDANTAAKTATDAAKTANTAATSANTLVQAKVEEIRKLIDQFNQQAGGKTVIAAEAPTDPLTGAVWAKTDTDGSIRSWNVWDGKQWIAHDPAQPYRQVFSVPVGDAGRAWFDRRGYEVDCWITFQPFTTASISSAALDRLLAPQMPGVFPTVTVGPALSVPIGVSMPALDATAVGPQMMLQIADKLVLTRVDAKTAMPALESGHLYYMHIHYRATNEMLESKPVYFTQLTATGSSVLTDMYTFATGPENNSPSVLYIMD